jgi:hypothetical protein
VPAADVFGSSILSARVRRSASSCNASFIGAEASSNLDLGLEAVAFGLDLGDTLARGGEGLEEPLTLTLAGGDRPFERLDLGAAAGGILADPSTDLSIRRHPPPLRGTRSRPRRARARAARVRRSAGKLGLPG